MNLVGLNQWRGTVRGGRPPASVRPTGIGDCRRQSGGGGGGDQDRGPGAGYRFSFDQHGRRLLTFDRCAVATTTRPPPIPTLAMIILDLLLIQVPVAMATRSVSRVCAVPVATVRPSASANWPWVNDVTYQMEDWSTALISCVPVIEDSSVDRVSPLKMATLWPNSIPPSKLVRSIQSFCDYKSFFLTYLLSFFLSFFLSFLFPGSNHLTDWLSSKFRDLIDAQSRNLLVWSAGKSNLDGVPSAKCDQSNEISDWRRG